MLGKASTGRRAGAAPAPIATRRCAVQSALVLFVCLALVGVPAHAANTEPTLALMRATATHSSSGRITVALEGSFSFADTVQLALPLQVRVTQGSRSALCGISGGASVSVDGGPPQDAPAPCVIGLNDRTLTLVLPAEFGPGAATAQLLLAYENKPIASNVLSFTL